MATKKMMEELVPYEKVPLGFEAVFTGRKRSPDSKEIDIITTLYGDEAGNEVRQWPVFSWTWPGREKEWNDEIKCINAMQKALGHLEDDTRQIRAHIASLVPCDSGFPVTVDELLDAIGNGKLSTPSFRNGCWCSGMWWQQKTTQPYHMTVIREIYDILVGYLDGKTREYFVDNYPAAAGFVTRTYEWLGPVSGLTEVQRLMMKRMLLTLEYLTRNSDTANPSCPFSDPEALPDSQKAVEAFFGEDGPGAELDADIAAQADLPKIYPNYTKKFTTTLNSIADAAEKDLYQVCAALAHGLHTLSDCHHSTFRWIESWVHGIGTGTIRIPNRQHGTERRRLGNTLFGYLLGLDKWLLARPLQLVLMDLGYVNLGFDPRDEILRVYAYLGEQKTPVKEWLAACLWHNLTYCDIGGDPAGIVRHKGIVERAKEVGVTSNEWMNSILESYHES